MAFEKELIQSNAEQEGGDLKPPVRPLQPDAIQNDGVAKTSVSPFEAVQPFGGGALNQHATQPTAFQEGDGPKVSASGFESVQGYEGADKKQSVDAFEAAQTNAFEQGGNSHIAIINLLGIPSGQLLGAPSVGASVSTTGIASQEALGTPALSDGIRLTGVASAESFGLPIVFPVPVEEGGGGRGQDWWANVRRKRMIQEDESELMVLVTALLS